MVSRGFDAPTFLIFPLGIGERSVGMIYADGDAAGSLVVSADALSLLRTLRNQALVAIKQG